MFNTPLTRLLAPLRLPVVVPPMAGVAGGALAAQVTKGGGFGFVGGGNGPLDAYKQQVELGVSALGLAKGDKLPFGLGVICWALEGPHGDPSKFDPYLEYIVSVRPRAVWFSFGNDLRRFVQRVRELESLREGGGPTTKIFIQVGTVKEALEVKQWPEVDVVVAQGTDSGGHGTAFYGGGLPTTSLIPLLAPHFPPSDRPVLLAAGGISTGSQLLSTLALGASGAIMGTRFLASTESLYSSGHKDVVIKAKGEDTVRTMKFDWARGTVGWDKGVDGRGVSNLTSEEEWKEEDGKLKYDQAMKDADMDRIVVWAGTSVGSVTKREDAADIVKTIEKEAVEALATLQQNFKTLEV